MATSVLLWGARGNGRHDDFSAVQKAIRSEENVIYFPKGKYIISDTLRIPSGKHLILHAEAEIILKAKRKCRRGDFVLTNSDPEGGNRDIIIEGGILNGNSGYRNHVRSKDILDPNGYSGILMNFCGVENLTVRDITLKNPVAYYTRFCRVKNFRLENIVLESKRLLPNQDGVHFAGEVRQGVVKGIRTVGFGQTNDDLIAVNADDALNRVEELDTVVGAIEDITFEDIEAENCHTAVRLLSTANPIRNLTFKNIRAGYRCHAVNGDGARNCRVRLFREEDCPQGVGRLENITFEKCTFTRQTVPLFWKGTRGKALVGLNLRERMYGVTFSDCRFTETLPHKKEKGDFKAVVVCFVPGQRVVADGKTRETKTKEDCIEIENVNDLRVEKIERRG